jgi:hypothetical protein
VCVCVCVCVCVGCPNKIMVAFGGHIEDKDAGGDEVCGMR